MIKIKRVYESADSADGTRIIVERLWPRGMSKEDLRFDAWIKDAAPSTDLRRWFGHDPARWEEFRRRYFAELDANAAAWQPLIDAASKGNLTLLYSARDTEHNNAQALREYLENGVRAAGSSAERWAAVQILPPQAKSKSLPTSTMRTK